MGPTKTIDSMDSPEPFTLQDGAYGSGGLQPEFTRGYHWGDIRDFVYPSPEWIVGSDGKESLQWPE